MNEYGTIARVIHLPYVVTIGEDQLHGHIAGGLASVMIPQLVALGTDTLVRAIGIDAGLGARLLLVALIDVGAEVRAIGQQFKSRQATTLVAHHLVHALVFAYIRYKALVDIAQRFVGVIRAVVPPVAQQVSADAGAVLATEIIDAIAGACVRTQRGKLIGAIATVWFAIARLILEDAHAILALMHLCAAGTSVRRKSRFTAFVLLIAARTVLVAIAHVMRIDAETCKIKLDYFIYFFY